MVAMAPDIATSVPEAPGCGSHRLATVVVWLVWAGMTAAALAYVGLYGSAEPYMDDWDIVPVLTGHEQLSPAWLWAQHNEHRLPLPRLLLLGLLRVSDYDFRAGMVFNVLALSALAAALVRVAARLRGRTAWTDLCLPVLFLNWGHSDNLLWAWQVQFGMCAVLAGALVVLIAGGTFPWSARRAVVAALCLVGLPLCGGCGLPFAPPLALWFAVMAAAHWRIGARRTGATFAAAAVLAVAITGLYFIDYDRPADMPERPGIASMLRTAIEFLSLSFGLFGTVDVYGLSNPFLLRDAWFVIASAAVSVYALAAGMALWACRRPEARWGASGLLLFLAGMAGLALAVAWGRSGFGEMIGLNRRYVTLTAPGVACAYLIFLLYGGRFRAWLETAVFVAVLAVAWPATVEGRAFGRGLRLKFTHLEADVRAGLPPLILADRYTRFPAAIRPRYQEEELAVEMDGLRRLGAGPFQKLAADPAYRVVPASSAGHASGPNSCAFPSPRFIYAIRFRYRFKPPADGSFQVTPLNCSWVAVNAQSGQPLYRDFQATVTQDGNENFIHFWVGEPIRAFTITPSTECRIWDIDLLVPP